MQIKKVDTKEEAIRCDELLNKLIESDNQYDDNINGDFKVDYWYPGLYDQEGKVIYIVLDDNKIVGYIYGYEYENTAFKDAKHAFIDALYVEDGYRGKGYGSALIKEYMNYCKENNIKHVQINAYLKNKDAIKLYEKLGFKQSVIRLERDI